MVYPKNGKGIYYKHVSNPHSSLTLYVYWIKSSSSAIEVKQRYASNKQVEKTFKDFTLDGYLTYQDSLEIFLYGNHTSDYNGCGWIATYNALRALQIKGLYKEEIVISDIIRYYDYHGTIANGTLGTEPWAIEEYFKILGFSHNTSWNYGDFEKLTFESDVAIIGNLNIISILDGGHYRMVHYFNDRFYIYNPYGSNTSFTSITKEDSLNLYYLLYIKVS